jgi:hypothetical protein
MANPITEALAANVSVQAVARLSMIATPLMFTALAYYYVNTDQARAAALLDLQTEVAHISTWKEVTAARLDAGQRARETFQVDITESVKDLAADTRAGLEANRASSDQMRLAIEGLTVTLRLMQQGQKNASVSIPHSPG